MSPASNRGQLVLFFDGDCGFCTWSGLLLRRLDRNQRLELVPCQRGEVRRQLGIAREQCEAAALAVGPDGERYRGAGAVSAAIGSALGSSLPLRLYAVGPLRWLLDRLYDWVAAHRGRLPGVTPYCQRHPDRCLDERER